MAEDIVPVRFVWTYETEVPRSYIGTRTMDDIPMEAFTQGDGDMEIVLEQED